MSGSGFGHSAAQFTTTAPDDDVHRRVALSMVCKPEGMQTSAFCRAKRHHSEDRMAEKVAKSLPKTEALMFQGFAMRYAVPRVISSRLAVRRR